jgi:hypothetical protein
MAGSLNEFQNYNQDLAEFHNFLECRCWQKGNFRLAVDGMAVTRPEPVETIRRMSFTEYLRNFFRYDQTRWST